MKTIASSRRTFLWAAACLGTVATASAAVVDVPGNNTSSYSDATHNLDFIVGAGNSARLLGDFYTHWNGPQGSFSVPVDTNGFVLRLDTGGGNAGHLGAGAISGSGSITVTAAPHFSNLWNTPYTIGGSDSNSYAGATGVARGTLLLNKTAGADALLGTIAVGSADQTARVEWGAADQINDLASITLLLPTVSDGVTADANLNYLDLAGFSDTIGSLALADDGTKTQVRTGAGGVLTVGGLTVNSVPVGPGNYTSLNSTFVFGTGSVVVIPEPGAAALGVLGLLGLLRRRRA